MIIERGVRGDQHAEDCGRNCGKNCIENWKRGAAYVLPTKRLSHVRLYLENADVIELFYALIERHRVYRTPQETLAVCAETLARMAAACQNLAETEQQRREEERSRRKASGQEEHTRRTAAQQGHLDRSVEELEISARSYNCLKNANIQTISELVQKTEAEMMGIHNFGCKSLIEVNRILWSMGLHFGMKFE